METGETHYSHCRGFLVFGCFLFTFYLSYKQDQNMGANFIPSYGIKVPQVPEGKEEEGTL